MYFVYQNTGLNNLNRCITCTLNGWQFIAELLGKIAIVDLYHESFDIDIAYIVLPQPESNYKQLYFPVIFHFLEVNALYLVYFTD